jgi:DNA polymerase I-like protein with 3'-5' exonuclease and polymerase domains
MEMKDIHRIVDHFQIKKIKKEIELQHSENGYFYNLYGRPIYDIGSPVNYWLQSSAADYSCLAFLNLVERLNLNVKACIHDAIIVEVNSSQSNFLKKIKKIIDPNTNIKLHVEQTPVK